MTLKNYETRTPRLNSETVPQTSTFSNEKETGIRGFLKRKVGKATVAVAGLLVAGGAALGVSTANERGPEITPPVAADTEKPTTPETQAPVVEVLPTVESLEIDPSLFDNPNALIESFVEGTTTDWINAGATPENAQAALDSGDMDGFTTELAGKYDALYIEALLIDGWESDPALVRWVDNVKSIHDVTLNLYFKTSFPDINPEDEAPYRRVDVVVSVDSLIENQDGTKTLVSTEHTQDNEEDNRVGGELTEGTKASEALGTPTRTFANIDGKIKLYDMILG